MTRYFRPLTLAEALDIRAEHDVAVLAGGTDIHPARIARRAWGDPNHKDVLDLSALSGLRGIEERADHWRLGALTTWSTLARAPLPPLFDGYRQAATQVGGLQVQNTGTLAGNIVTASPAGDGIPNLMALDARVELTSRAGTRTLALAAFNTGYRKTALRPDEIVTALIVPKLDGAASAFRKLGARKYLVISIAMVAVVVAVDCDSAGRSIVRTARIAAGSCSPVAERLGRLEAELEGWPLAEAPRLVEARHLAGLRPVDDIRASAAYRLAAALTLVRDSLAALAETTVRRAA